MVEINDIREGSVVVVRGDFGSGRPQTVTVKEIDSNIKNDRPGICYDSSWAYLTQVDSVVVY